MSMRTRMLKKGAPPATTDTKPVAKTAAPQGTTTVSVQITYEDRERIISEAAYFRAEKSGFQGDPFEHWLAAEAEVLAKLGIK